MAGISRFFLLGVFIGFGICFLGNQAFAQTSLQVKTATASIGPPDLVPVGNLVQGTLAAEAENVPTPPYGCALSDPSWAWDLSNVQYAALAGAWGSPPPEANYSFSNSYPPNTNPSSCTLFGNIGTPGYWKVKPKVTVTYTDTCNNIYTATKEANEVTVTVVAVVAIAPNSGVSAKHVGDTLTKDDFIITTSPPGYENMVTVDPVIIVVGDNWVTATCGSSSAMTNVTAAVCSGEWGDLLPGGGPPAYDTATFTAKVEGSDGNYTVAGPTVAGGDTSGFLANGMTKTGTVNLSGEPVGPYDQPPGGLGLAPKSPAFLQGRLAYGLGSFTGSANSPSINALEPVTITVTAAVIIGGTLGINASHGFVQGQVVPALKVTLVTNEPQGGGWNPGKATADAKGAIGGQARYWMFGYKYTLNPAETVRVEAPIPISAKDPMKVDWDFYTQATTFNDSQFGRGAGATASWTQAGQVDCRRDETSCWGFLYPGRPDANLNPPIREPGTWEKGSQLFKFIWY